jgi:MFS family permease
VGSGLFAWAASCVDAGRLLTISLAGTALLSGAFGFTLGSLHAALWTALLLGIIANASMSGLYAVGPTFYPTAVRATGMGSAVGVGRFGAILAPVVSGVLLDRGRPPAHLYLLYSIPFAIAALSMLRGSAPGLSSHTATEIVNSSAQ